MPKKKIITSYNNLRPEILELVKDQYPEGFLNHAIKVEKGPNDYFHAITLDTEDTSYLIKVEIKIDNKIKELDDSMIFGNEEKELDVEEQDNVEFNEDEYVE